jgi:DNA-binding response OmpR family regulator
MTTNTITARQYFQNVLDAHLSEDMDKLSVKFIAGLDARNEKRKSADSKEKREVRARRDSVLQYLTEHKGESFTRDQIAEAIGISGAAVSSACKALGDAVCKAEVKIDKARRVVYTLAE